MYILYSTSALLTHSPQIHCAIASFGKLRFILHIRAPQVHFPMIINNLCVNKIVCVLVNPILWWWLAGVPCTLRLHVTLQGYCFPLSLYYPGPRATGLPLVFPHLYGCSTPARRHPKVHCGSPGRYPSGSRMAHRAAEWPHHLGVTWSTPAPLQAQVIFKISYITAKALYITTSVYLVNKLTVSRGPHQTRSSNITRLGAKLSRKERTSFLSLCPHDVEQHCPPTASRHQPFYNSWRTCLFKEHYQTDFSPLPIAPPPSSIPFLVYLDWDLAPRQSSVTR